MTQIRKIVTLSGVPALKRVIDARTFAGIPLLRERAAFGFLGVNKPGLLDVMSSAVPKKMLGSMGNAFPGVPLPRKSTASGFLGDCKPRPHDVMSRCARLAMLLFFLTCASSLFAQSLTVFDIDASAYPVMRAKFYAFDASGNQLMSLSPGDLQLREDGMVRTVTRVTCPAVSPFMAISSVLSIDRSSSMSGTRMQAAKVAAREWIGALILGHSECAVTSFNDRSFISQDFTTDRAALLMTVDALNPHGSTDFDAALLSPPAGALEVCTRGKSRKVIVFMSDGNGSMLRQTEIIAEAQRQGVTVYALMLGMPAPRSVKDICAATGGLYFELITTEAEAADAYRHILHVSQGGSSCEVEWTSAGCGLSRELELELSLPAVRAKQRYAVPSSVLPQLVYTPSRSLHFGGVAPGTTSQQQMALTAQGAAVRIDAVTVDNPLFSIVDYGGTTPPFTLGAGEGRTLSVEYAPTDSTYAFCRIDLESDACFGTSFYTDGGWRGKLAPQATVRVVHPNGGERLVAGSEAELIWEGVMPEDTVRLEYSVDGGAGWLRISDEATGLRHPWRVPKQPSDRCLLRVTTVRRPVFIGDMALIPPGTFRMGNITEHPDGNSDEKPVHEVTITQPFLMARTEVTQKKYEAVMGSNPSRFKGPDLPVENVTWLIAVAFCNELSRQEGLAPCYSGSAPNFVCDFTANGYRLPTEAEWEYACRASTETDFYTGNMANSICTPLDPALDNAGWYCGNENTKTCNVAQKQPNAFGLYDMHGNVWEWCWDWYGSDFYAWGPAEDPSGPAPPGNYRVLRGGAWREHARHCRSSCRKSKAPYEYNGLGFRVVRKY